jgi:acyl-CoA thioesterase II
MFELSTHGTDVHVGVGPQYPWGGLYGGQIVAQSLRAAAISVDPELEPHSIRAYFIRRGDHTEPVRYEVDRIRNGRSFATRRVVARQAVGAILNAESSFQRPERAAAIQTVMMPEVPAAETLVEDSWTPTFDRVFVPTEQVGGGARDGTGRAVAWMRVNDDLGDPADAGAQLLHRCWLAYLSDDMPTDSVIRAHPDRRRRRGPRGIVLREPRPHDLVPPVVARRPLASLRLLVSSLRRWARVVGGHVFDADGTHVATIAQEVLVRDARDRDATPDRGTPPHSVEGYRRRDGRWTTPRAPPRCHRSSTCCVRT